MNNETLRQLPSVDELLNAVALEGLEEQYSRDVIVNAIRTVLEELRLAITTGETASPTPEGFSVESICQRITSYLHEKFSPSLRKAVNATGIILHTGLGRAVLPQQAVEAINDVATGYSTLAIDIESGRRGHRDVHLNDLLCELTGAEAATVVNNNAAATMLILNTLARGREVIVSRGQLVEIGGSFRMPDVMETSGAILKEVGTTNKTHLRDYVAAISENTGAILRVHQSNYRIVGFFEEPPIEDLVAVGRDHNLSVIDDLGSGALMNLSEYGLEDEPMVQDSIRAGVDVACFSGDKLIGGPQSGVIVGKAEVIETIRRSPLARAMRIGKLTTAAMAATLRLFLNPDVLNQKHPCYQMLSCSLEELNRRARAVADRLAASTTQAAEVSVVDGGSQVGSGSVPAQTVPTRLLRIKPVAVSAQVLARMLRCYAPPIFARVQHEAVLFDFRTIQPDEDALLQEALCQLLGEGELQL